MSVTQDKCNFIDILRKPKIFNMSIFDWVGSLLGAWIIGKYLLGLTSAVAWSVYILFWIALGVFVHWALGVKTMLGYYLGVSEKPTRKSC